MNDTNGVMKSGTIETMVGIVATALIVIWLSMYLFTEPNRINKAQQKQLSVDLNAAMRIYAENCSVCHGIAGAGIGSNPPLNKPALKESDPATLSKIISRGLFKTPMPAWSKEDGGPLSDYQVGQMVTLIRFGDWQATHDLIVNIGLAPMVPFASEADPKIMAELKKMKGGDVLAKGVTLFAGKCVACHGADGMGTALAPALNSVKVREKPFDVTERTLLLGVPGTLMAGWESSLLPDDVSSLLTLIKEWDRVPAGAVPVPDTPIPVTKESLLLGKNLYARNCSACHGLNGQGRGRRVPSLNVKGFLAKTNDRALEQIVTRGVPETPMPAWGDRMTKSQIQAVVGFVRSWEPTAPEVAEPVRGGGPWWQTEGQERSGLGGGGGRGRGRRPEEGLDSSGQEQGQRKGRGKGRGQGQGRRIEEGQDGSGQERGQGRGQRGKADQGSYKEGPYNGPNRMPPGIGMAHEKSAEKTLGWKGLAFLSGIGLFALILIGIAAVALKRLP